MIGRFVYLEFVYCNEDGFKMKQSTEDEVAPDNENLLWDIRRCRRYNIMRAAWCGGVYKWANVVIVFFSTSAFMALWGDCVSVAKWTSALVAFISTVIIFFDFPGKKSLHEKYAFQYTNLLGEVLEAGGRAMKEEDYKVYCKKYYEIQAEEDREISETHRYLMIYCESEVARCEMENSPIEDCASTAELKKWHFFVRQIF